MKSFRLALFCIFAVHASFAQGPVLSPEAMVNYALNTGIVDGHVDKYFIRSGDAGAVTLAKVLGEKTPTDDAVESILIFVKESFSDLQQVEITSDREPRVTLFLLKYLDHATQSSSLKAMIAETRTYVLSAYAKLGGRQLR